MVIGRVVSVRCLGVYFCLSAGSSSILFNVVIMKVLQQGNEFSQYFHLLSKLFIANLRLCSFKESGED
jgi:hypothetical protein